MSVQLTPTTVAYRSAIAHAAKNGTAISPLAWMAFGTEATPYSPDADINVPGEFIRLPVTLTVQGTSVIARAVLSGTQAGVNAVCGAGVFTANGVLVGRRTLAPKELEAEAELEIEINFEY